MTMPLFAQEIKTPGRWYMYACVGHVGAFYSALFMETSALTIYFFSILFLYA